MYSQEFSPREEALSAEKQIQGWSRRKNEALIKGDWWHYRRMLRDGALTFLPNRSIDDAPSQHERVRREFGHFFYFCSLKLRDRETYPPMIYYPAC